MVSKDIVNRGRAIPVATICSIVRTSEMDSFLSTDQICCLICGIAVVVFSARTMSCRKS